MRLVLPLTALVILGIAGITSVDFTPLPEQAKPAAAIVSLPQTAALPPSAEVTSSIPQPPEESADITALKQGLDALSNRAPLDAIAVRDGMDPDSLDRHILTWAIALSGQRDVPSATIATAARELTGWPGLATLAANTERALAREKPPASAVLAAFAARQPETPEGTILFVRALTQTGDVTRAGALLRQFWASETLEPSIETAILEEFGSLLTPEDHRRRMDMLLYRGRIAAAEPFSRLGKAQSLYRAWAAVVRDGRNASALVAAVDPSWHADPAYRFIRIENMRRQDRYEEAAKLLSDMPKTAETLVDTGEWWVEQRVVSRGLADRGDYAGAYRIAAGHVATDASDIVDAEFHAGWYALRGLKQPEVAARHFRRILEVSNRPISVSRAYYWLGRAAEAGGPGESKALFAQAAVHTGTFYGQLAAARIGHAGLNVADPAPTPDDRRRFLAREPVRATARLTAAGHGWRAHSLYRSLAETLESPGELALLSDLAVQSGGHQLALQIGKIAFGRGIDVAALAFPVGAIPDAANIDASGKALAYAIARQESAFDIAAVSPANARGLLQLLPGTAQAVAKQLRLPFSAERLTTDPAYNATLGAHYLGEQITRFDGSYILTFIAYNAGPRRAPEWMKRYGDPRGRPIDEVVDWIERIPFVETRNYVQRVMENYQVYKARLGQKADIVADLQGGRQS